ncbi:MAG TPA: phosphate ABC transporter substrate-binding protein [Candidatus Fusicatenibacter merdavium]|uniref:Phosphate-binding protein n=1 Tax=Candidatus Fusicatenibacter merdavium TaxID=2838600 RepID=A0A9D2BHW8_9FIRM|nr:phosphate ABC transporter substrate-binding protein [Candidatus Fusicatenibacter merdavium]
MKRKIMALVMTAIVATGMLAGCGGNSGSGSTSGSSAGSTSESAGSDSSASGASSNSTAEELSGTVTAAGSSALKPLADDAAEYFNELHPDVSITIDAGGSGQGLQQVADGTVDIGNSDVAADEKLDASQAEGLVDHQVCVITMAPIINPDVAEAGVTDLTKDQLISVFTGETTNWSEVGGPDEDIILITRPESSGTRATFEKYALDGNKEASNTSMETDDSGVLLQNVKDTKGAIGYVALSYLTEDAGVSTVAIDGVEPTLENTYNGTYPVWTYEHMYTNGEPSEVVQAFLDYIMSDDYGSRMEELGYGVSSKMTVTEH